MPSDNPSVGESAPDLEIVGNKVTIHPSGVTGGPEPQDDQIPERNLVRHMARFRENPFDFLREVSLYMSGTGWRAYNDVIGQPIFYPGFSDRMKSRILASPLLQGKVKELAELRLAVEEKEGLLDVNPGPREAKKIHRRNELEAHLKEVVDSMLDNMICKMESKRFIRGAYYVATQLLTRAYHQGIHVSSEEVLRLRSVAEEAARKKRSIVFLPCHKSHVDYVSLQLICYRLGIGLPVVVAGDNLNFPLVGPFLQHAGAMWIRRSFGNDPLYNTVVQAYIDTLLQQGFNFECFIEGGRSRTGKLLSPKFGILSFILDSVLSGRVEDTIICPVSTQYDKVIETESYISELLGQPKRKENLADFLSSSSVLSLKLGRVDVRFHEPWSLKEFITQQLTRLPDPIGDIGSQKLSTAERGRVLRSLGYRVLSDINNVSVMMPTALVGTVLLTLRGRGVGKGELVRRVEWLCERVRAKGGRVAHFYRYPTEVVVDRALEVLGPQIVGKVAGLVESTYYAVDRFQLSFYRNMTIHLFITEALVSAAMYTRIKQGGGPSYQRMSFPDLLNQVSFLSQLFRGEFIFPPEGLTTNLDKTLRGLEKDNVITVSRDPSGNPLTVELSEAERQCGRENYDFYCFLIWPFIEACWLGSVSLLGLTPPSDFPKDVWIDLGKAQDNAQLLGKTLYHQGDLSYFEAVNKETLKNSYQRFAEEGIIHIARSKESKASSVRLAPEWTPERDPATGQVLPRGRLWDFTELIAQSRREGKNRRDGATVSSRVMRMSDLVGRKLFEDATGPTPAEEVDFSVQQVRRKAIAPAAKL
ncbi:lysophospholipid acyltransferase family protein [Aspergillus saccharolyticus JOP 1030-1]|uniref:Putative acyltransferase n=1 Tax=Aspergillus saccharolyticus JOP 1030-1 TaxID=1450539 RepID=A0A318Z6U8_9EURO|nr:putative acyltransferase [Aspergillus saccharolyticus JOP 1030-1]PYH42839.1 putative acyltransferase [Aspergillus saccharolyticus JOP 1030-1]